MSDFSFGSTTLLVALLALAFALRIRRRQISANPKKLPLPPGPRCLPVIGSLLDMPTDFYWLTYTEWASKFGDVVYTHVCGRDIVILNSADVALDLLEKRSSVYSDRPYLPMFELMGFSDWQFTIMRYGPSWRLHRRTFHQYFNQDASLKYIQIITDDARKCLANCLRDPEGILNHIHHYFASSIFRIIYGIQTKAKEDPILSIAEEVMTGGIIAGVPGSFLIDMLPILKYVPEWFPGARFKKFARYYRNLQGPLCDTPFDSVQSAMANGEYDPSMVSKLLTSKSEAGVVEEDMLSVIKNVAGMAFLAGSDTTVSTLDTFVLAMALHPEVQQRLYKEVIAVIGHDRLPEFDEIKKLPYLHAVVREILRWQPVAPLGLAHRNQIDDEYRGYHIPKGCMILSNIWAILHDERIYAKPYTFQPDRFISCDGTLREDIADPRDFVFGFGRRICPGRHHAYNGALILAASLAVTFEIRPNESHPLPELHNDNNGDISRTLMESGLISHPRPFKCKLLPRSEIISSQLLEG